LANQLISMIAFVAGCATTHAPPSPPPAPPRTQIVILGTGTPIADPERQGPSVAIIVDGVSYLIDAGAGIVRRAAATNLEALKARNLQRVFITHLHSDHTLGYPDLILSGAVLHSRAGFDKLPPDDQKYHAAFHTSAPELAALATKARAKTLVLHHQLFFGQTERELLGEVKRGFRGNLVSAHDLQTL
jgi:ribonuclease BN (tRNA processing enzyme)